MARRQPHTVAKFGLAARCSGLARRYALRYRGREEKWFRDLDSNQDTQLQRLMSYRLDDPGIARRNCSRGMQACTDSVNGGLWASLRNRPRPNGEASAAAQVPEFGRRSSVCVC